MIKAWRPADLHAYVDDCLGLDERLAFEKQIEQDPALARRAAIWRAQNVAICAAFDGEGARAFSISIVPHQNEVLDKGRRSSVVGARPCYEQSSRLPLPTIADASGFSRKVGEADVFRTPLLWRLGLAALSLCLACVWAPAATVIPTKGLGEADVAAFRAFVRPGVEPVEFTTSDKTQAQAWLTTRLLRPVYLPATPPTVTLVGARIAPYPGAAAAFLVYRSQAGAIGLLVQSLDAPATRAPRLLSADGRTSTIWTWRGQGFALVGELDAASLLKIANDFFDPPTEAVQPAPVRGW